MVSGPSATIVISPGESSTVRMMKCGASRACTAVVGGGRNTSPCPSVPCTNATAPRNGIASGASTPRATGMSERPAISRSFSALVVVDVELSALPKIDGEPDDVELR